MTHDSLLSGELGCCCQLPPFKGKIRGLGAGTAVGGQLLLPLKLCRRGRGPVWLPFDLLAIFLPGVQEDSLRLFWDGGLGN